MTTNQNAPNAGVDEAQLARMHEAGRKAWADVPNATAWVEELRGNTPECDTYCANHGCNRGQGCPGGDKFQKVDFDADNMAPPWRVCDLIILALLPLAAVLIFLIGPALDAWDAQDYTGDLQIAQECADRANGHEPRFTRDASGRLVCLEPKN